jgi:Family of unknown function (DUF6263)
MSARLPRRHARVLGVLMLACVVASCQKTPQTVSLSLALTQGMERTTRFTTEQRVENRKGAAVPTGSESVSLTYRFHVASVDAARTAKLECSVLEASVTRGHQAADAYLHSLKGLRVVATVDKDGRILALKSDAPSTFAFGGVPLPPDTLGPRIPARGDLQGFFGGLGGGKVRVGDTWTSSLPQSGGPDLQGTIHWTLSSIAGTTARLEYSGSLDRRQVSIPGLPPGKRAMMNGNVSGYVLLELDTGWPRQGRSVINSVVTVCDVGDPAIMAPAIFSLSVIMRFEPAR